MEGGPWLFRGVPVVLAEYDGFSSVKDYNLDMIPAGLVFKVYPMV
jgi:hypothetical protein